MTSTSTTDLAPMSGPAVSLDRYLAGDVVTYHELITDDSLWVVRMVHPAHLPRFEKMLEYTRRHECDDELCRLVEETRQRYDGPA